MSKYNNKLNKICKFALSLCLIVLILSVVSFPSLAEGISSKVMGLDDYLNGTEGVDYFGYEIDLAETNLDQSEQALNDLNSIISAVVSEGKGVFATIKIDSSKLPTHLQEKIETEKVFGFVEYKTLTLMAPGLRNNVVYGNGFATFDIDVNKAKDYLSHIYSVKDTLEKYISEQKKSVSGLHSIYKGFSVVGNVEKNEDGSEGAKSFTVGFTDDPNFLLKNFREKTKSMYTSSEDEYDEAIEDEDAPGTFEKEIANLIGDSAFKLYLWMSNWNVDLTMDGLIFGRLSPQYKGSVDFTHFGMEVNNPYGIVAATAYYVLRRMLLGVLPVIMMGLLFRQLFNNGQKGRAIIKETMSNFVLVIVLSFIAPYLIEICITLRDGVLKYASLGMGTILSSLNLGSGTGSSVIGLIYVTYRRNQTFLNALVWAAAVGSGFFYLATYIQIAMLLTGCIAILPLVLFVAIWNRKILKDWWNVFFPNLCVPLVDLILLQIPAIFLLLFKQSVVKKGGSMILGILIIIIMWNSLMIRDRVIRLLGFEGLRRGPGLFAAARALLDSARKMTRKMGSTSQSSKSSGSAGESKSKTQSTKTEAAENKERGNLQNEALRDIPTDAQKDNPSFGGATDEYLKDQKGKEKGEGSADVSGQGKGDADGKAAGEGNADHAPGDPVGNINPGADESGKAFAERSDSPADDQDPEELQKNKLLSDVKPTPNDDFKSGLSSDAVRNRYDNLTRMDAYNNKIRKNENAMQKAGYNRDTYRHDRMMLENNSKQLDNKIKDSKKRMKKSKDHSSEKWQQESAHCQELMQQKADTDNKIAKLDKGAALDKENNIYKDEVARRSQIEQAYGRAWGIGGMNTKTYENAKDFEVQTKIDNAKKKFATYKDFDSKRYEGILSPSEKENFYRKRLAHERQEKAMQVTSEGAHFLGKIATKTAGVAVGATIMTAGMAEATLGAYGGEENVKVASAIVGTGANIIRH